jgi:hypothetical protein
MNARELLRRPAALAIAAALALAAPAARAACTYVPMASNATVTVSASPTVGDLATTYYLSPAWTVSAVRPSAGEDWDMTLYQGTAPDPQCVAVPLASSSLGGDVVDFVVGDLRAGRPTHLYPRFSRWSGSMNAQALWRESARSTIPNGYYQDYYFGTADDLVDAYEIALTAGQTYTVVFDRAATPNAKLFVFYNPGTGAYYAGRSSAYAMLTGTGTFTPPATGVYLFVVANDGRESGIYTFGVGSCTAPVTLTSGVPVETPRALENWTFSMPHPYWAAVAVRDGVYPEIEVGGGLSGPGYPNCLSDVKAASREDYGVNFVTIDFNSTPTGTYYATTNSLAGLGGQHVEFEGGADMLTVNAPQLHFTMAPEEVVRTYDIYLVAGTTYNFAFTAAGAITRMYLFRNPGGAYFGTPDDSEFWTSVYCQSYTAPSTGYYGVVVYKEESGGSSANLGVSTAPCACPGLLRDHVVATTSGPDSYYQLTSFAENWTVVGVRGANASDDWDLQVGTSATGGAAPTCINNLLASSGYSASAVDFVATNGTDDATGGYRFARAHHVGSASGTGVIQWSSDDGYLQVNDPYTVAPISSSNIVHLYQVYLQAGVPYTIDFLSGNPAVTAHVMENPGAQGAARGRASAIASGTGRFNCVPAVSGLHAIVIANDGAVSLNYGIRVARCTTPIALGAGAGYGVTSGVSMFSMTPAQPVWHVAGVQSSVADWDITASASLGTTFPNCLGSPLANSTASAYPYMDLVAADFHHAATGTPWYLQVVQFTEAPLRAATVEWEAASSSIEPNVVNPPWFTTDASHAVRVFDLPLTAGQAYTISLNHADAADLRVLLFRNGTGGSYWAGRASAAVELAAASGSVVYTAPASDVYGLVVVNDNAASDIYSVSVKYCPPPTALVRNAPVPATTMGFYSFLPRSYFWSGIGVRSSSDWDLEVSRNPTGGPPGNCFSASLAGSGLVGPVDFVVGDFNTGANPIWTTYYARPFEYAPNGVPGLVEFVEGYQVLNVNDPRVTGTTGPDHVMDMWDVFLLAGQSYNVFFTPGGYADTKLLLFRNPGGEYWAPRSQRVLEATGPVSYTAEVTGWHGLVVVNDNGATGSYALGLYPGGVAVEDGPQLPSVTALRGVAPNPARGEATIEYALHEAAPVRIEVLDMAGRRVATLEDGDRAAGTYRVPWARAGGAVPPGLYFVRLQVAGRTVGEKKVALVQ